MIFLAVDDEHLQLSKLVAAIKEAAPDNEIHNFRNPLEALEFAQTQIIDVAFLDIEMGGLSGIELAKKLKEINPLINIIFVTGYTEYALDAVTMHASGYLTKPVTSEKIKMELEDLRFQIPHHAPDKLIRVQCFGDFEVYYNEEPVKFARSKTKEMFAYLIDRQGAMVTMSELSKLLFNEDKSSYVRNLVADLTKTMKDLHIEKVITKRFNGIGVNTEYIDCDYYDYLNNEAYAVKKYRGEFLNQYEWAKSLKNKHFRKRS
ncbi:MAG: response regulator [Bacilli bacterium]|nr:response regulator [Bacilli bacterium]